MICPQAPQTAVSEAICEPSYHRSVSEGHRIGTDATNLMKDTN
jgi:hypothetical protein